MNIKRLLSYVRKACDEYKMIDDGDKIAVGISGGKDSLSLLVALKSMQRFYPKKYDLEAISVSLGIGKNDFSPIQKLCDELDVNYSIVETDIGDIVFNKRKEKNPCSLCAKMRKGSLNEYAKKLGCNKIAYGHNKDDVIETFFMAMLFEGRIYSFSPVSYWDRTDLYLIRPLIYVSEEEIISFIQTNNLKVVKNNCPVDGYTKREETKNLMRQLRQDYDRFDDKIFTAIQRSDIKGWKNI